MPHALGVQMEHGVALPDLPAPLPMLEHVAGEEGAAVEDRIYGPGGSERVIAAPWEGKRGGGKGRGQGRGSG